MELISFLILFPLVISVLLLFLPNNVFQKIVVYTSTAVIMLAVIFLTFKYFNSGSLFFSFSDVELINKTIFYLELALSFILLFLAFKYKKILVIIFLAIQFFFMLTLEKGLSLVESHTPLYLDQFSLIMALIIGIIGGIICIYAVTYMKGFHKDHQEVQDRRPFFFFILFVFISSMFAIVFTNNLSWLYFAWEITTVCSFLLIGYKKDAESIKNSFWALLINLFGGICFAIALIYMVNILHVIELSSLTTLKGFIVFLPLVALSIAGLTKSAQLPFSTWLTGAMVAPTPVSALLHSSTMVKAGVFLLVKMAPMYTGTAIGILVALIGGFTFLITSFIAVTQRDAKKILAYSTIANLGLIVLCAGIGTYEAVWAAILLIIFHAIAKCLLFLCVGLVEHILHNRDLESMDGLILKMPKLAWSMLIGMAGMFLAPFGMLISKWAVLKALTEVHPSLAIIVIFGSAATLLFWVKWMGKLLIGVENPEEDIEKSIKPGEWASVFSLGFLTVAVCLFFPVIAAVLIEPYIINIYGHAVSLGEGNIIIMTIMMGLLFVFPFTFPWVKKDKRVRISDPYLAGLNSGTRDNFYNSLHQIIPIDLKNYYLTGYLSESKLLKIGFVLSWILIIFMFVRIFII